MQSPGRFTLGNAFLWLLLGLAAILLPLLLQRLDLPIITYTYSREYLPFELFGLCGALALMAALYLEWRKRRNAPIEDKLPLILLLLVGLHFLILITEYSTKSGDYEDYQRAANAVLHGLNPYDGDYLYPPLTAQTFALTYRLVAWTSGWLGASAATEEVLWNTVFYLFQCGQFFLILIAFVLCYLFARELGLPKIPASVLVGALFVFNSPLIRTLRHNQVNLYILDLLLLAILLLRRYPLLSGAAAALGGHIKLYPLILLAPWALGKKIAAVASTVISFFLILLLQIGLGRDSEL